MALACCAKFKAHIAQSHVYTQKVQDAGMSWPLHAEQELDLVGQEAHGQSRGIDDAHSLALQVGHHIS